MKHLAIIVAVGALAAAAQPASAAVTQVMSPDAAYTTGTTLLAITGSDFSAISGLSDSDVSLTFGSGEIRSVPGSWSTWGSPSDTESSTPKIVYTGGLTTITFQSNKVLSMLGFEAEPNPFDFRNFTVDYYLGGVLQGSISRSITGSAGARLLAASGTFDKAVVTSSSDFSFAQVRYDLGSAVPEPATWAMMIIGFGAAGSMVRSQRRRQALAFA